MSDSSRLKKIKKNGNNNSNNWKIPTITDTILRMIWKENQVSRAEISKRMGIARSTATEIVKGLIESGFVSEVGTGKSSGGRKPIVLEFKPETGCVLGLDIGATHISVVLTDLRGKVLQWREQKHPVRTDPEGTKKLVFELCDLCLATKDKSQRLINIGVALPSPIDPAHPELISQIVLPEWHGRNDIEQLGQRYGVPVYIDNDANLGAIAEHRYGAGRGVSDLIYVKSAYGVGAGYILGGEIYRGATGSAGEMGHLPIDIYGQRCVCGNRGCLATFVGAEALGARSRQLFADFPESSLNGLNPTISAIENAALAGDPLARRVVREAAEYLGIAIAGWINMMNPTMVILGGDLSRTGELLVEPIREKIRRGTLVNSNLNVDVRISELGSKAIAIGAATLALEEVFAEPNILKQRVHPGAL